MWSGGFKVPEDAAGVKSTRETGLDLTEQAPAFLEDQSNAQGDLQKAIDHKGKAGSDVGYAKQDVNTYEGKVRGYEQGIEGAEDQELQWRHQLEEQWGALNSRWREWQSSKSLADTKQAIYNHQLNSFCTKEISAFFQEARQREGEIARVMHAVQMKMSSAMIADVSKSSSSASTQLSFAVYARLDGLPTNEAISLIENVKAEYSKLIEQGKQLSERTNDPFYKDKIDEQVGRLEEAQSMLNEAQSIFETLESVENAAKAAVDGARGTYQDATAKVNENNYKQQEVDAGIKQYNTVQQQKAMKQNANA